MSRLLMDALIAKAETMTYGEVLDTYGIDGHMLRTMRDWGAGRRRRYPVMNEEDVEEAGEMWRRGLTRREIAVHFGVCVDTVRNVARAHRDLFPPRHKFEWTDELVEEATRMRREGRLREFAEAHGVKPDAVRAMMRRRGIEWREG